MDFTVACSPTISHKMMDNFAREAINLILQFCKFFYLSQNISHLDLFKQMSAEKHLQLS